MPDIPLCSRQASPDRVWVELRPKIRAEVCAVLDAACVAHSNIHGQAKPRDTLVNEILTAWAIQEDRKARVISNVTRGNPPLSELDL